MAFVAASTRFDISACGSDFCSGGRLRPNGNAGCCNAAVVVVVTPAEICFDCSAIRATEDVSTDAPAVAAAVATAAAAGEVIGISGAAAPTGSVITAGTVVPGGAAAGATQQQA
mmetsp:Transcript_40454/g.114485  ORF Transcript_40454/g.114485 Transcript_40454/m.114485 type:complete len:114 (+) Transcript_40454:1095-1436(+)